MIASRELLDGGDVRWSLKVWLIQLSGGIYGKSEKIKLSMISAK